MPPEIGELVNLQSLDFSSNRLSTLPVEISQLSNLRTLSLYDNQLSTLPTEITQLSNLRLLDLSRNQLSTLPAEIAQLSNLRLLDLSNNHLSTLPPQISQLSNLRTLSFNSNRLGALPPEITQLTNLRLLYLGRNELSTLPPEITQLTNLRRLDLFSSQLSTLPAEITQLTNLQELYLGSNQLSALPVGITQLHNLRKFNLANNQLTTLPVEIAQLTNLQTLDIWDNQLRRLPVEITQLSNLKMLNLSDNQLSTLPAEIAQLSNLRSLYLSNNQLSTLPVEIKQLSNLKTLDLRGNPVPIAPEILGPKDWFEAPGDVKEILDFYFQVQDPNETDALYEAKFLIVGEGGAGKTSLAKKIQNEAYTLQSDEKSTQGIEVIRWNFVLPNGKQFRVNIWDFGGQEIYHHTHQFFLTERSLYALVADTRQDNTDFYYWLNVVELLSDNSPVLIIKNEKQDRQCDVNERQLRGEFLNLKEVLATNLANNRGLENVRDAIQRYVTQLPHVGSPLPKLWVRVRSALENYSRNYISVEEYCNLCRTNGLSDRKEMLQLNRYLHDLGVCLHFQDDPLLKHTVILKPEWGTSAVYKVLDNETVNKNLGCFTQADLTDIWNDVEYAEMRDELLQLMMRFKLCYEIPGRSGTYIAPQLLSVDQADYEWDDRSNLILRYSYDFMPKGILSRLIVETHPWIEQQKLVWKNGVVLYKDQTRAEIIEYYSQRQIRVRVVGSRKKELLAVVAHELDKIHSSYERLRYRQLIPCNCDVCKESRNPYSYDFNRLQQFIDRRQFQIMCYESGQDVDIRKLISDLLFPIEPAEREFITPVKHLQLELAEVREQSLMRSHKQEPTMPESTPRNLVFISYSHKDQKWFNDFKIHLEPLIREQHLNLWDDTQIKPGAIWLNEIEAALAATKVAVLLVSPDFLASKFINNKELPTLLDAVKAEGVKILWVPLRYSNYRATAIERYQGVYPPDRPLTDIPAKRRDKAWVEICDAIRTAINA